MAFYYINGMRIGGIRSYGPDYGFVRQQMKRVVYNWLTKIVGWAHVDDESGDPTVSWATPELGGVGGIADGVSDLTDADKFTSATGGFSALTPLTKRYYLLVKGFADSTRDGFYLIDTVISNNELRLRKEYSLHTDGLPLNETGLTWWVFDFYSDSLRPYAKADPAWWVLAGTGVGGTFHLRCQNVRTYNYMRDQYDISPYPDWDAVGNAWQTPPNRYTAIAGDQQEPYGDSGLLFGVADSDKRTAVFWLRQYDHDLNAGYSNPIVYYFGDMVPFRPTQDTRPVVCYANTLSSSWTITGNVTFIKMIADDNSQQDGRILYPSRQRNDGASIHDGNRRTRSYHSGRVFRVPYLLATEASGAEEVRGYLKDYLMMGHLYGDRAGTPFGSARDMIRLGGNITMRFNGSRQYYYIF